MKHSALFVGLLLLLAVQLHAARIYRGSSTAGSAAYTYSASESRLYRGSSTAGSAIFTYERGDYPKIYRGSSTAGSAAYTLEYSDPYLRLYRGSSTAGSPIAVFEKWDGTPKPVLFFIAILIGE